jgi:hypothetical protein
MVTKLLYIDEKLLEELKQAAQEEDRSVNNMIIYILKKYLDK